MKNQIDILLINPPIYRLYGVMQAASPLGLLYLSRYLNENGFKTKVYNSDYEGKFMSKVRDLAKLHNKYMENLDNPNFEVWKFIRELLNKYSPKIVGITAVTNGYLPSLKIVKIVKEELPNTKVILGGPHVTALPEDAASEPGVDAVVIGEGELTMLEIAKGRSFKDIKGICFKDGNKITNKGYRELIEDIDILPFPRIEDMIFEKSKQHTFTEIYSSRGCPYGCTFCESPLIWRRKLRLRSPKKVYEEILFRKKNYGVTEILFWDDAFTLNKERLIEICKYLKKLGIRWVCQTRADHVSKNLIKIMKDSGCWKIALGVESGNQEIINKAKKNLKIEDVIKAVKILKEEGIYVVTYFMFGLPGETEESIKDSFNLVEEIKPDEMISAIAIPLPGTEFFEMAKNNKWLIDQNWANYYTLGRTDLVVDLPTIERKKVVEAYWKSQKLTDKLTVKAIRKEFLNPLFIYKHIKIGDLIRPHELLRKIKILYNVIKG